MLIHHMILHYHNLILHHQHLLHMGSVLHRHYTQHCYFLHSRIEWFYFQHTSQNHLR